MSSASSACKCSTSNTVVDTGIHGNDNTVTISNNNDNVYDTSNNNDSSLLPLGRFSLLGSRRLLSKNNLKNHYQESVSAKKQIEKLEAYYASSSWPQFVLNAAPGTSSLAVDNSVISPMKMTTGLRASKMLLLHTLLPMINLKDQLERY